MIHAEFTATLFTIARTWKKPVVHIYAMEYYVSMKKECDLQQHGWTQDSIHGHHQMVNTEIRLILFFAAKDGEALYSQQKQDQELTVAQIMNSLLLNSDLN